MRTILVTCTASTFLIWLQGCSSDAVESLQRGVVRSYTEYVLIEKVEDYLHRTCAPDSWCDPYSTSAAKECLGQHLDLESLLRTPRSERDEALDALFEEVAVCSLGRAHELHDASSKDDT